MSFLDPLNRARMSAKELKQSRLIACKSVRRGLAARDRAMLTARKKLAATAAVPTRRLTGIPLTREEVLDELKNYLCDVKADELTALGEAFKKVTFTIEGKGDAMEMHVVFFDGVNSLEFSIPMMEKVKIVCSLGVDGPVVDYAHSLLNNLNLNVRNIMDKWFKCLVKDGPNEFVIPLRNE